MSTRIEIDMRKGDEAPPVDGVVYGYLLTREGSITGWWIEEAGKWSCWNGDLLLAPSDVLYWVDLSAIGELMFDASLKDEKASYDCA